MSEGEGKVEEKAPEAPVARSRVAVPLVIVAASAAVIGAGVLMLRHAEANTNKVALASEAKGVTVVEARAAAYRATRRYVGTLEPWLSARTGPQLVSAYVEDVLVRPGAVVRRGDVLATLDCRGVGAQSKAVAMQARALEARQRAVASETTRLEKLADGGFIAQNDVDQKRALRDAEQAQLLAVRSQLSGRALEVNDCVLRAPFDGEVAARHVDPGAFVRPGSAVVSVVDRSTVRLGADVPESDFGAVAPGTDARLRLVATGKTLSARVTRRSPAADPSTRTVRLEIDLDDRERSVPVGTTAEIEIDVGEPVDATEVPLIAAKVKGDKATVFVVEGDVAKQVSVEVLGESGGSLFVKRTLAPGARVVTEGRSLLANNDRVVTRLDAPHRPAGASSSAPAPTLHPPRPRPLPRPDDSAVPLKAGRP